MKYFLIFDDNRQDAEDLRIVLKCNFDCHVVIVDTLEAAAQALSTGPAFNVVISEYYFAGDTLGIELLMLMPLVQPNADFLFFCAGCGLAEFNEVGDRAEMFHKADDSAELLEAIIGYLAGQEADSEEQ